MEKDVKQVKLSVEGADVEIASAVLGWDNRKDDDAHRRNPKGRRTDGWRRMLRDARGASRVKVQYKILGENRRRQSRSGDWIDRGVTADQSTSTICSR